MSFWTWLFGKKESRKKQAVSADPMFDPLSPMSLLSPLNPASPTFMFDAQLNEDSSGYDLPSCDYEGSGDCSFDCDFD